MIRIERRLFVYRDLKKLAYSIEDPEFLQNRISDANKTRNFSISSDPFTILPF